MQWGRRSRFAGQQEQLLALMLLLVRLPLAAESRKAQAEELRGPRASQQHKYLLPKELQAGAQRNANRQPPGQGQPCPAAGEQVCLLPNPHLCAEHKAAAGCWCSSWAEPILREGQTPLQPGEDGKAPSPAAGGLPSLQRPAHGGERPGPFAGKGFPSQGQVRRVTAGQGAAHATTLQPLGEAGDHHPQDTSPWGQGPRGWKQRPWGERAAASQQWGCSRVAVCVCSGPV